MSRSPTDCGDTRVPTARTFARRFDPHRRGCPQRSHLWGATRLMAGSGTSRASALGYGKRRRPDCSAAGPNPMERRGRTNREHDAWTWRSRGHHRTSSTGAWKSRGRTRDSHMPTAPHPQGQWTRTSENRGHLKSVISGLGASVLTRRRRDQAEGRTRAGRPPPEGPGRGHADRLPVGAEGALRGARLRGGDSLGALVLAVQEAQPQASAASSSLSLWRRAG